MKTKQLIERNRTLYSLRKQNLNLVCGSNAECKKDNLLRLAQPISEYLMLQKYKPPFRRKHRKT